VERYVRCSLRGDLYEKAYECLKAIREACVKEDEAPSFNKFLARVKDMFGRGPHKDFFGMLKKDKVSLITAAESEISSIVTP
jgi:ATP-dependent DNA helicase 2 subunit 2